MPPTTVPLQEHHYLTQQPIQVKNIYSDRNPGEDKITTTVQNVRSPDGSIPEAMQRPHLRNHGYGFFPSPIPAGTPMPSHNDKTQEYPWWHPGTNKAALRTPSKDPADGKLVYPPWDFGTKNNWFNDHLNPRIEAYVRPDIQVNCALSTILGSDLRHAYELDGQTILAYGVLEANSRFHNATKSTVAQIVHFDERPPGTLDEFVITKLKEHPSVPGFKSHFVLVNLWRPFEGDSMPVIIMHNPTSKCFEHTYPYPIAPLAAQFKTLLGQTKHELLVFEQYNSENDRRRLPHVAVPIQAVGHPAHQDDNSKGTRCSVEVRIWAVLQNRI